MIWLKWLLILAAFSISASCAKPPGGGELSREVVASDPAATAEENKRPMTANVNDINWLVSVSPFVFVGHLTAQSVEKDRQELIVTKNEFSVERVIVGDATQKVVRLTTLGGSSKGQILEVSHMPKFVRDKTYLIFTDLARTVYNPITGNDRGVFIVTDAGVFTYRGQSVISVENGSIQLGEALLSDVDTERSSAAMGNPTVSGGIASVQRSESRLQKPLSIEDFSAAIRTADVSKPYRGQHQ